MEVYRKATKFEWCEAAGSATAAAVVNNPANAAMAAVDKRAIAVGGINPQNGRSLAQVLEIETVSKQWNVLGTHAFPHAISEAVMVSAHGWYILFGGWNDESVLGTLWVAPARVDDSAPLVSWKRLEPSGLCCTPRRYHAMVAVPLNESTTTVYVFGGFDGARRLNDLWSFTVTPEVLSGGSKVTWTQVSGEGECPSPRDGAALAFDHSQNRLLIFGGYSSAMDDGLFSFNIETQQWMRVVSHNGPSKRHHSFALVHQNYLIVGMGQDAKGISNQICQMNLLDGKWSLCTFEEEVEGRLFPAVTPLDGGKRILIFAGLGASRKYLNSTLEVELEKCEAPAGVKSGKK
jgi:hypothetical protein